MTYLLDFASTTGWIVVSVLTGYLVRRRGWVGDRGAKVLATIVAVFGYPAVGFLAIWATPLSPSDAWLPILGAVHLAAVTLLALPLAALASSHRKRRGVFAMASGLPNAGPTMGGLVAFLLFGEAGLGYVGIYTIMFVPMVVFLMYPIARHYCDAPSPKALHRLWSRSLMDWRAIGLPVTLLAVALSALRVPRPDVISDWRIVDVLVYAIVAAAYFAVGLRLHVRDLPALRKPVAALAGMRFGLAPLVGVGLVALTWLTPLPMHWAEVSTKVFVLESFVPTAVTVVALSNMFRLDPRYASALFVANTLLYVVAILPWLLPVLSNT